MIIGPLDNQRELKFSGPLEEGIRHNCGFVVTHTLHDAYSFAKSVQHRGREAAGIGFIGDERIDVIKWIGKVDLFSVESLHKIFPSTGYHTYVAHVRYATRGRKDRILEDAHPQTVGGYRDFRGSHEIVTNCDALIVHNGQVDYQYVDEFSDSESDSKGLLMRAISRGLSDILTNVPGSYTAAIAMKGFPVQVIRDRYEMKPGALGWKDGKYVASSEDIAFRENGGKFIKDLEGGNIHIFYKNGDYESRKVAERIPKNCFFEWNYISGLESIIDGLAVRRIREELGIALAREFPLDVDYVSFVPRCPEVAARKYAEAIDSEFIDIFYKVNETRSFLGSTPKERRASIEQNLFIMPPSNGRDIAKMLNGKKIAIIDDSIVRGNNSAMAVKLLKSKVKPKELHLLSYTPKIGIIGEDGIPRGCFYGVDMPPEDSFIARKRSIEEISKIIGANVGFLSVDGMLEVFEKFGFRKDNLCHFCIGGNLPF